MLKRELVDDDHCQGVSFGVGNRDALVRAVALVLVQEFALARDLVSGATSTDDDEVPVVTEAEVDEGLAALDAVLADPPRTAPAK